MRSGPGSQPSLAWQPSHSVARVTDNVQGGHTATAAAAAAADCHHDQGHLHVDESHETNLVATQIPDQGDEKQPVAEGG